MHATRRQTLQALAAAPLLALPTWGAELLAAPVAYGTTYFVGWHVPTKAATGTYSFCVVAVDKAGNKSRPSCAGLTVK